MGTLHHKPIAASRGFFTPRGALFALLACLLAALLVYLLVHLMAVSPWDAALDKRAPKQNDQPLSGNSDELEKQRLNQDNNQNNPLNTEESQEGCFDNNRFCFELTPSVNNAEVWQLALIGKTNLPVAVTLYSKQLYLKQADNSNGEVERKSHISTFLSSNSTVSLGYIDDADAFWKTMRVRWTVGTINAQHDSNFAYMSPLQPASEYSIVQGFNGAFSHSGASRYAIDFAAPVGTPVLAARAGTVIDTKADGNKGGPTPDYASHANYVVVLHSDGTTGEYYHLRHQGVAVERGQYVQQGQLLGYSGNTGFSSLPHLHFGIYVAKYHGRYTSVPFSFKDIAIN